MSDLSRTSVSVASEVAGVGMSVPDRVVTNDHFASYLETNDEWIQERTGIRERRWAPETMSASELAVPACEEALKDAGLSAEDIDGVIVATVTPDYVFPSTACILQKRLGLKPGLAMDVNAVCSGFIYALTTADSLIASGQCKNILVVGSEIYSRIIDPNDRSTCILFGDGAGALVLTAANAGVDSLGYDPARFKSGAKSDLRGIYCCELGADGKHADILSVPMGSAKPATPESLKSGEHFLHMEGREVFKLAVRRLVEISKNLLERAGMSEEDLDFMVSHQANKRILTAAAKQLGMDDERNLMNVDKYGNTSAASLPILLCEAAKSGTLKKGDLVLLSAFGGGVTWGAMLLRW